VKIPTKAAQMRGKRTASRRTQPVMSKRQRRARRRNIGVLRSLLKQAEQMYRNNALAQIDHVAEHAHGVPAAIGVERDTGQKQEGALFNGFKRCIGGFLRSAGGRIGNLSEFSQKHFLRIRQELDDRDYGAGTIQNYESVMRRMTEMLGMPGIVPTGRELIQLLLEHEIEPVSRTYIPEFAKGWRDMGVDIEATIARVSDDDYDCGLAMKLMHRWGLRIREAVSIQPQVSWKPEAGITHVYRGTKGKKERNVPLFNDPECRVAQVRVMEEALEAAKKNRSGEIGFQGQHLDQAIDRIRSVCRRLGITKAGMGVTPHGLRHQFGCDGFTDQCGLPAPVLAMAPAYVYAERKQEVEAAMLHVSRALGHERMSITGAYAGTVGKAGKKEKRLRATLEALARPAQAFVDAGVTEAWLSGPHAIGADPKRAGMVVVYAACSPDKRGDDKAQAALTNVLSAALGGARVAIVHAGRPDDGVEILFQNNLPR
jgi:integrase